MRATDIDPHVYSVICDSYDQATNQARGNGYPLHSRSPGAQHFAFELLMRLRELGYHVVSITDDPAEDFR
jgi:hypothetical protein